MYLASVERIDPEKVGLVGQSEGANIVAMVAARRSDVAFSIALAGAAVSGYDVMLAQSERALRNSGLTGPALEAAMAGVKAEYELVLNPRTQDTRDGVGSGLALDPGEDRPATLQPLSER